MNVYASFFVFVSAAFCALGASSIRAEEPTCNTPIVAGAPPPQECRYQKTCPKLGGWAYCPAPETPPYAELQCAEGGGAAFCEAWPQSDTIAYRYVWSVISGVSGGSSTDEHSPFFSGGCTGRIGKVAVTVIAPNGTSNSMQTFFNCDDR